MAAMDLALSRKPQTICERLPYRAIKFEFITESLDGTNVISARLHFQHYTAQVYESTW